MGPRSALILLFLVSIVQSQSQNAYPFAAQAADCCRVIREYLTLHPDYKIVKLYGLFNTGTNYAFDLLSSNGFEFGLNYTDRVHENARRACIQNWYGWKHGDPNQLGEIPAFPRNASHVFPIIMVRNPFAWISSTIRQPYNLRVCLPKGNFRPGECKFPWGKRLCLGFAPPMNVYSNFAAVWGEYYTRMLRKVSMTDGFYIRYEDLVLNPDHVLDHLWMRTHGKGFGPASNSTWQRANKDNREWVRKRSPNPMESASRKIAQRSYLNTIPTKIREFVCAHPESMDVMKRFHYTEDCE
jgi:hypothetical protein